MSRASMLGLTVLIALVLIHHNNQAAIDAWLAAFAGQGD